MMDGGEKKKQGGKSKKAGRKRRGKEKGIIGRKSKEKWRIGKVQMNTEKEMKERKREKEGGHRERGMGGGGQIWFNRSQEH